MNHDGATGSADLADRPDAVMIVLEFVGVRGGRTSDKDRAPEPVLMVLAVKLVSPLLSFEDPKLLLRFLQRTRKVCDA